MDTRSSPQLFLTAFRDRLDSNYHRSLQTADDSLTSMGGCMGGMLCDLCGVVTSPIVNSVNLFYLYIEVSKHSLEEKKLWKKIVWLTMMRIQPDWIGI